MNHTPYTWDTLLKTLKETTSLFRQFLELLNEEERVLRLLDRQRITEVNAQKEQVLDSMCRYEDQIVTGVQQLTGSEETEASLSSLNRSSEPKAAMASTGIGELRSLAHKIREQGRINEGLIRRTQHVVGEAIHLIYTGLGRGPVYQDSGALSFPAAPGSVHLHG